MVKTTEPQNLITDTWVKASWEMFVNLADHPDYEKARFYYDRDSMRIEMAAVAPVHARDNSIVSNVVTLFATLKNLRIVEYTNASFRKVGVRECQPDIAFYIDFDFRLPPRTNTPINVNEFGAPSLAIEIASTTLSDDLGRKRLLYERLGVKEYWVVDVNAGEVIAFEVAENRSGQIQASRVLPGLAIATIEEALNRSQSEDDGAINRWLMQLFQT